MSPQRENRLLHLMLGLTPFVGLFSAVWLVETDFGTIPVAFTGLVTLGFVTGFVRLVQISEPYDEC